MSLPDAPNTLREKYYSVMAGQNDADILPDIETAPSTENRYLDYIARNGGGGGDVTKEYVDTSIANAVAVKVDKVEGKGLSTNDYTNADQALVQESPITSTSTTSPITNSADGIVQELTVYGRSEVVEGKIKSVGEGYAVVDLGTLSWSALTQDNKQFFYSNSIRNSYKTGTGFICAEYGYVGQKSDNEMFSGDDKVVARAADGQIKIRDDRYSTSAAFIESLTGKKLVYQLADPTQGNLLAVKTDNGTGIDGTMATFTTALPLRGVSSTVRDKLTCMADKKQVETVCGEVDLGTLTWNYDKNNSQFWAEQISNAPLGGWIYTVLCSKYVQNSNPSDIVSTPHIRGINDQRVYIVDLAYSNPTTFTTAVTGAKLIYPLATPTVTPLTAAEISAFRGLKTYDSTTNITITDEPEFELDYLKNTENGQTVADIQKDLQRQMDDKITVSPLLTLTVTGWDSTTLQQTVTFLHDTTKRNVIDVDPASVEEWAACGIIARYETASNITFTCKSIPENALSFKVTSMGV